MTYFATKLLELVKKHYVNNYKDIFVDIIANFIDNKREFLFENQHVEYLITCMKKYPDSVRIQEVGLSVFAHTVLNSCNRKINDTDKIVLAFNCMQKYPDNTKIQDDGLLLFEHLIIKNPDNKQKIIDKGGIILTLDSMEKHFDVLKVQLHGIFLLARLIENKQTKISLPCNVMKIVSLTCNVMKHYPTHDTIQAKGLLILGKYATHNLQIINQDGITLAFDSMKKYIDNVHLHRNALYLLSTLSNNHDNQQKIVNIGGITIICDSMKKHTTDKSLQEHGLNILANLLNYIDKNTIDMVFDTTKKSVSSCDAYEIILDILEKRKRKRKITKADCTTQKVRKLNNGNYITDDGIVLVPLHSTKVKTEK